MRRAIALSFTAGSIALTDDMKWAALGTSASSTQAVMVGQIGKVPNVIAQLGQPLTGLESYGPVSNIELASGGYDGNRIAFTASFQNGLERIILGQPQGATLDPLQFHMPFYANTPHGLTVAPGGFETHQGIDEFALDLQSPLAKAGQQVPVLSAFGGTIKYADSQGSRSFGHHAMIDHGPAPGDPTHHIVSLYAHLQRPESSDFFRSGDQVPVSAIIGYEGQTGTQSPHLHFDVFLTSSTDPFNRNTWSKLGYDDPGDGIDKNSEQPDYVTLLTGLKPNDLRPWSTDEFRPYDWKGPGHPTTMFYSDVLRPLSQQLNGTITEGETRSFAFYADGNSPLTTSLSWPGSELKLTITAPDGTVLSEQQTDGNIKLTMENPTPGLYTFEILGVDAAPDGEPFQLHVHQVPEPSSLVLLSMAAIASSVVATCRRRRVR